MRHGRYESSTTKQHERCSLRRWANHWSFRWHPDRAAQGEPRRCWIRPDAATRAAPVLQRNSFSLWGIRQQHNEAARAMRPGRCGQGDAARAMQPGRCGQGDAAKAMRPGRCGQGDAARAMRPGRCGQGDASRAMQPRRSPRSSTSGERPDRARSPSWTQLDPAG